MVWAYADIAVSPLAEFLSFVQSKFIRVPVFFLIASNANNENNFFQQCHEVN